MIRDVVWAVTKKTATSRKRRKRRHKTEPPSPPKWIKKSGDDVAAVPPDYSDYLKSHHWKKMRKRVISRAEGKCQVCNSKNRLQVHHRTYERIGQERMADLTVLCRRCHKIFHQHCGLR